MYHSAMERFHWLGYKGMKERLTYNVMTVESDHSSILVTSSASRDRDHVILTSLGVINNNQLSGPLPLIKLRMCNPDSHRDNDASKG